MQILKHIPDEIYTASESLNGLTLYHTKSWHQFLKRVFGWQVQAAIAYDDAGQLGWFLPFVRKLRMAKVLNVTLPFSHRIGPAWSDGLPILDVQCLAPLEIHECLKVLKAQYIVKNVVTHLDLTRFPDEDGLFSALHKTGIQQPLRRSEKYDIEIKTEKSDTNIDAYYQLEALTRQRQGAPMYPPHFFAEMFAILPDDQVQLQVAYMDGDCVAGNIFWRFRDTAIYAYSAVTSDREILRTGVNQRVLWEAIRAAMQTGCTLVDFGTTPAHLDGLLTYKQRWATESEDLPYTILQESTVAVTLDRESRMVKLAESVLQRLPLPLFKQVSPLLLRLAI